MEVFTIAGLIALIIKFTSASKYIRAGQIGDFLTQVFVWATGILAAFVAVNANAFEKIDINGTQLADLNAWSVVLLGLGLSSLGSAFVDYKKARDNNDTAAEPALFSNTTGGRNV